MPATGAPPRPRGAQEKIDQTTGTGVTDQGTMSPVPRPERGTGYGPLC